MRYSMVIFFFFSTLYGTAQTTALFETSIYIEDALGNKDSVRIGYDTAATQDIDFDFGEVELLTPFDSIFEVRAGSINWPEREKLSKKIIERAEPEFGNQALNCFSSPPILLYIWAKHQPIKVSWERTALLEGQCNSASFIADHQIDELGGPIDLNDFPPNYYCMGFQDSAFFDLTIDSLSPLNASPIVIEKEVAGIGIQAVYGLRFVPAVQGDWSPCYWVSSIREEKRAIPSLSIYPNPAEDQFNLKMPKGVGIHQLFIYGLDGKIVRSSMQMEQHHFNCKTFAKGLYQILVHGSDGKVYRGRFLKL